MFKDAHMHLNFYGYSADKIITYMNKNRINLCWLLTWEEIDPSINTYLHLSVEDVFEAYERYPSRIIPMYAPDPHRRDACQRLKSWYKKGIQGCGELKVSLNWDSTALNPFLDTVNELGIPIIFHMEGCGDVFQPSPDSHVDRFLAELFRTNRLLGIPRKFTEAIATIYNPLMAKKRRMSTFFPGYMLDFESLERRLIEYPSINFVGHGPLFWKGISTDFISELTSHPKGPIKGEGIICRLLSQYDNLYADISGPSGKNALQRDPKFAQNFLHQFEKKILFGTDNCSIRLREFLDSLKLSKKTYRLIYGENALKIHSRTNNFLPK